MWSVLIKGACIPVHANNGGCRGMCAAQGKRLVVFSGSWWGSLGRKPKA